MIRSWLARSTARDLNVCGVETRDKLREKGVEFEPRVYLLKYLNERGFIQFGPPK